MEKRVHVMTAKPVVEDLEATVNFPVINDGWEENIAQLLAEKAETEEFTKEYIRERLQDKLFAKEIHEETPRQKFMLGQLLNEMYDKFSDQLNVEDFVNASSKLVNSFMSKDYLFCKNDLYSSKTDLAMFEAINEFTSEDMLTLLVNRVHSMLSREKARQKKWKANLENYLLSNPVLEEDEVIADRHPSLTARSKSFNNRSSDIKDQLFKLEADIMRLEEETSMLQKYKADLKKELEATRGCFEKPNIDISAKVKMSSKHDHQRLDKMLFNMREDKDLVIGLTVNKVEQCIIAEIAESHKYSSVRLLHNYLKIVPNTVYTRSLSQHPSRVFTRLDFRCRHLRQENEEDFVLVKSLDQIDVDLRQNTASQACKSVNFYEYILQETSGDKNFFKFVFGKRKLTNLTISMESLSFLIDSWRLDEQGIGSTFKEFSQSAFKRSYFKETINFPGFVIDSLISSMSFFSEKIFLARFKSLSDQGLHTTVESPEDTLFNTAASLSSSSSILDVWYRLLKNKEKLELFNQQVDNQFMTLVQAQNNYMEFSDYYDLEKVFDMNRFSKIGLTTSSDRSQIPFKRLINYINAEEKIKIKKAFWIKEGLIFKLSQKQPNEHHASILLKDQIKHPYVENWLQLVLNNDPTAINYDLLKFTTDLFEVLDIRQESLFTEKTLTKGTLESYVKLLMLRSRNSILKLLSYTNFSRAVQKNINLRFIDLCEQHREQEDLFDIVHLNKYRKDDLLKQTKMYDRKECEEVRRIFDEAEFKVQPVFGYPTFDPKFSRLITTPDFKPYLYTNPIKGGQLGGVITNLNFDTEEDLIAEDKESSTSGPHFEPASMKPDNPFAEDKIEFIDLSQQLSQAGPVGSCPFVSISDANNQRIIYDAAIHDFFDLMNDLSLLLAFYLENDAAYYQDDQFEDLDLQFEENLYDNVLTQKNIKVKLSKFNHHFNYETLVTQLLELECQFQAEKTKLCHQIYRLTKHVSDSSSLIELYDYLTDLLSRRPHLDLTKYSFCNQNNTEWMHRATLKRESDKPFTGETTNLITTFVDNYRLEIEYFQDLNKITEDLIEQQEQSSLKVDAILRTFEAFQGLPKQHNFYEDLKPSFSGELICPILKQIDNLGPILYSTFICPNYLDKNTFTSIIFDTHFKKQIEEYLDLPIKHDSDFTNVLNDFMNSSASRYKFFVEQTIRKLAIAEVKFLMQQLADGLPIGDDAEVFEGELVPIVDNCFSVFNTAFNFFKVQPRNSQLQTYDNLDGVNVIDKEAFMQQMNRYYSFLANFSMSLSTRHSLLMASYSGQLYKCQVGFLYPVLESLSKNARFEKPEDMLNTQGNLILQFMDFGDACPLALQDICMTLKEDLRKGANNIHHMSRMRSIHAFTYFYQLIISLVVQVNSLTDKLAESEASNHLNRILTSKESVLEHIYKFEMISMDEMQNSYIKNEARKDFMRGEMAFKNYLYHHEDSFQEIFSGYIASLKKDCHTDLFEFSKMVHRKIGHKYMGTTHEIYDTEETAKEADIGYYFVENSMASQEVENSRSGRPAGRREQRKVSKVDVPARESRLTSVGLAIPLQPFVGEAALYFRRTANYLALWLQSLKMFQSMFDRALFMSYNPDEVINFEREIDLGLSRLQQTVMKLLKYKHFKYYEEEQHHLLNDIQPLFDELGNIKSIFKVIPQRKFVKLVQKDLNFLFTKELTQTELNFFLPFELIIFKRAISIQPPKYPFHHRPEFEYASQEVIENLSTVLGPSMPHQAADKSEKTTSSVKNYLELYNREILLHLKKFKSVEISEINKISSTSSIERQAVEQVLSNLHPINFDAKKSKYPFGSYSGFVPKKSQTNFGKKVDIDREMRAYYYDDYAIHEVQETNLFIYFTQSNKMLSTVTLKLLLASLDLESNETALLLKKSLPFYTLNNLRLAELENILFNVKKLGDPVDGNRDKEQLKDEKSSLESSRRTKGSSAKEKSQRETSLFGTKSDGKFNYKAINPKFEYRKLRRYLYIVKRIELKNRSNSRGVFTFVEEVKKKMSQILDDAKLAKPDTVFNTYLNCLFENEQRAFAIALIDSMAQSRWLECFYDLIDINLEKVRKDKELFFLSRSLMINLMFPKSSSFKIFFDLFSTTEYLNRDLQFSPDKYPYPKPRESILKQLHSKKLYSVIRRNNLLNLFESSMINQDDGSRSTIQEAGWAHSGALQSFNDFSYSDVDYRWDSLFTELLAFKSPQRTFISRKAFQILLATTRNISLPKESILPHNIWIFKILDAHRLLDLNLKNMLLMELLNSKIVNDLYCAAEKEGSSVVLNSVKLNGEVERVVKRQYTPSLLPFVRNSMFEKEENLDFYRLVLRLSSTELHLTSYMANQDLLATRYPDLNTSASQQNAVQSDVDNKLKKGIKIDRVWSQNPIIERRVHSRPASPTRQSKHPTFKYFSIEQSEETSQGPPYKKGVYHEHKVEILKHITEGLRHSFFITDVTQAFNMCYLLLREFTAEAIRDQVAHLKVHRKNMILKNERCKERDSLVLGVQREMMTSIAVNSYVLETKGCGDQVVIRKNDLSSIALQWNDLFVSSVQDELRRREIVYLIKIDDIQIETDTSTLTQELIDFYFGYISRIMRKLVGSRLVLRNASFVSELDCLSRFITFVNIDCELAFNKIAATLDKKTREVIEAKRKDNAAAVAASNEKVRNLKDKLIMKARRIKEDTLSQMKDYKSQLETGEIIPHDLALGKSYTFEVPLYEKTKYEQMTIHLKCLLDKVKVWSALKLWTQKQKLQKKHVELLKKLHEQEDHDIKLENLLKEESNLKSEIIEYQKNISRLEIQNNLLRKEIHNSQFERIKLLKRTNEIKNKTEELQWEGQKYQIEKKNLIAQPKAAPFMQNYERQLLKNIFAENNLANLDYHNHPENLITLVQNAISKDSEDHPIDKRAIIKKSISKNDSLMKMDFYAQNRVISEYLHQQSVHQSSSAQDPRRSDDQPLSPKNRKVQTLSRIKSMKEGLPRFEENRSDIKSVADSRGILKKDEVKQVARLSEKLAPISTVSEAKEEKQGARMTSGLEKAPSSPSSKHRNLQSATTDLNSHTTYPKPRLGAQN